jgi:ribonuclease PH
MCKVKRRLLMRPDGRKPDELRPVRITLSYLKFPEGSTLIEIGDTKVICTASIEERVPPFMRGENKGWVTAEYALLPRSTEVRTIRESARGRISGRSHEIQRLIGRSLRSVVDLKALGERTVWIDCDVIQADGGTRTAAITGAYLALVQALQPLWQKGAFTIFPVRDFLAATSVGIIEGQPLLDLDYGEDSSADVDMNVVMTGSSAFVEVQGTAEGSPYTRSDLNRLLDLAAAGIAGLISLQQDILGPDTTALILKREGAS